MSFRINALKIFDEKIRNKVRPSDKKDSEKRVTTIDNIAGIWFR